MYFNTEISVLHNWRFVSIHFHILHGFDKTCSIERSVVILHCCVLQTPSSVHMDVEEWKSTISEGIKHDMPLFTFRDHISRMNRTDKAALKRLLNDPSAPPLREAARYGRIGLVWVLLEFGADKRTKYHNIDLALHTAAEWDQVEVLKILLENDEDAIKELGVGNHSPLLLTMKNSSWKAFTYILENHSPKCFSWSFMEFDIINHPLYYAASMLPPDSGKSDQYTNGEIMRLFLKNGCPNEYNGEHLVAHAARRGDIRVLKNLVEHSDPSKSDLEKAKEAAEKRLNEAAVRLSVEGKTYLQEILSYLTEKSR